MSSPEALRDRNRARKFLPEDLPEAESPFATARYSSHYMEGLGMRRLLRSDEVVRLVVMLSVPQGARIATACGDGCVRVYVHGDDDPWVEIEAHSAELRGLAVLDDHVLVSAACKDGKLYTWDARSGKRMDAIDVGGNGVGALAAVGPKTLVAGLRSGAVVFIEHTCGRQLAEVAREEQAHSSGIRNIAWHGDVMVTACDDKTARVWSLSTRKPLAVLRGHRCMVSSAAVSSRYIATGSVDTTVRLYTNGAGFPLAHVLVGLHSDWICALQFIGSDLVMSGSADGTMCFTAMSDALPIARLRTVSDVVCAAIAVNGHVACVGWSGHPSIFPPPRVVAGATKHAEATFSSVSSADVQHLAPPLLQGASIDAHAGRTTAGDASRRLNLRELEELALSADAIRKLDVEQSSCLLAASMVMFKKRYAKHYAVIERGIFRAFDRTLVCGESLVDTLDADEAFRITRSGLNDDGEYLAMEKDTRKILEGRLRSFLVRMPRRAS